MDDAAPGVSTSAPPAYVKYVAKQFAKIEVKKRLRRCDCRKGGGEREQGGLRKGKEGH